MIIFRSDTFGHPISLFRVIGFFDGAEFIALEAFIKRGQKLGRAERDAIDRVVEAKQKKDWKRR